MSLIHRKLLSILAATAFVWSLSAGLSYTAKAADTAQLNAATKVEIEKLKEKYLTKHPEIIVRSIKEFQADQQAEEARAATMVFAELRSKLKPSKESPVGGNPSGDVTVAEFFDYRCPYCKRVFPTLREIIKSDGKIRIVYKELPILGLESVIAARGALAVQLVKPEKYEVFHQALMDNKGSYSEAGILKVAKENGIDVEDVKKAMADPWIDAEIKRNRKLAESLGIIGTPTFVIGKELVPSPFDRDTFAQLIRAARASGTVSELQSNPAPAAVRTNTPASSGINLQTEKAKCADLGFKAGTEKFGECVLKLSE